MSLVRDLDTILKIIIYIWFANNYTPLFNKKVIIILLRNFKTLNS